MKIDKIKTLTPLKIHLNITHRIGFLPDMHVGSSTAVSKKGFEDENGMIHNPNEAQKIINMQWKRISKLYDKYKIQYIFIVGDTFTGINYRETGRGIYLRLPDQVSMASELLEPICKNRKVYVWRGTQYHEVSRGEGEAHRNLVSELRMKNIDAEFMDAHSYIELVGPKRTRRLFIAHEAPTALVYPATLMSRDIQWALYGEARGTNLPVDAIIRAHLHTWLHVDHDGIHAVQLPCWQGHHAYKSTIKYFFKLQPTIGGAIMLMDKMGRLQFWGGSYPFSLNEEERTQLHLRCIKVKQLKPQRNLDKKPTENVQPQPNTETFHTKKLTRTLGGL